MPGVVLITARFESHILALIARDRLRRHQVRAAGKIRVLRPQGTRASEESVVVTGPVRAEELALVRTLVGELGGRLFLVVEAVS
jgi:hypothetical protein